MNKKNEYVQVFSSLATNQNDFLTDLYIFIKDKLKTHITALVDCEYYAEDILHDAFFRFYQLDNFETIGNPIGYLWAISHNLLKDNAKAKAVRDRYKLRILQQKENQHVDDITTESHAIAIEELEIFFNALNRLPKKCRNVFLMSRLTDLNQKQIAQNLGITVHAVEKHVIRAKARIAVSINKID